MTTRSIPLSGPRSFPWGNFVFQELLVIGLLALFVLSASSKKLISGASPPTQTDYIIAATILVPFIAVLLYFGRKTMRRHRYTLDDTAINIKTAMDRVEVRIPYEHLRSVRLVNMLIAKRIWLKTDEQEEWLKGSRQKFPSRAFYHFALYPGSFAEANEVYRFMAPRVPKQTLISGATVHGHKRRLPPWSKVFLLELLAFILWLPISFVIYTTTGLWPGYAATITGGCMLIFWGLVNLRFKETLILGYKTRGRNPQILGWTYVVTGALFLIFGVLSSTGLLRVWLGWEYGPA